MLENENFLYSYNFNDFLTINTLAGEYSIIYLR
jgi:hypothetical protein